MDQFDLWNIKKKKLNLRANPPFYHERDIWWCSLGKNIGAEQDGEGVEYSRPVVIIKGLSKNTCLIAPLTSSANHHSLRIPIGVVQDKDSSVIVSQMKVIDTKRLLTKIFRLSQEKFEPIRKAARELL